VEAAPAHQHRAELERAVGEAREAAAGLERRGEAQERALVQAGARGELVQRERRVAVAERLEDRQRALDRGDAGGGVGGGAGHDAILAEFYPAERISILG